MPSFPDRLKELRKQKGVTQKQVAEFLNMTERGFRGYEMGISTPSYEKLMNLADYFSVSLDYLTGRTDIKEALKGVSCDGTHLRDEELKKMIEEIQANNIEENKKLKKLIKEFQIVAKKRSTENASKIN